MVHVAWGLVNTVSIKIISPYLFLPWVFWYHGSWLHCHLAYLLYYVSCVRECLCLCVCVCMCLCIMLYKVIPSFLDKNIQFVVLQIVLFFCHLFCMQYVSLPENFLLITYQCTKDVFCKWSYRGTIKEWTYFIKGLLIYQFSAQVLNRKESLNMANEGMYEKEA